MADLPYMPFFVDDYEAATAHLTPVEDGIYCRLLRLCWRSPQCSLPDDPAWISRRLRIGIEDYHTLAKPIIEEFFTVKNNRISQKRLLAEWAKANRKQNARVEAGRKGGLSRKSLKNNETGPSDAKANEKLNSSNHTHTHNQVKNTANAVSKTRGTRLPEDWIPGTEYIQFATGEGMTFEAAHREANNFRDYWISQPGAKGVKANWLATWRNWIRRAAANSPRAKQQQPHHNQAIIESFARIASEGER